MHVSSACWERQDPVGVNYSIREEFTFQINTKVCDAKRRRGWMGGHRKLKVIYIYTVCFIHLHGGSFVVVRDNDEDSNSVTFISVQPEVLKCQPEIKPQQHMS